MEKNAEFIRKKEFNIVFKGYKPEEVDKFLDIVSSEFDRLLKKNIELQENLDRVKFESKDIGKADDRVSNERSKLIEEAIISAHKTADEIKDRAQKEADQLMEQAQKDADNMVKKRKNEEENALKELQVKKNVIEESISLLEARYDGFRKQVKEISENLNNTVNQIDTDLKKRFKTDSGAKVEPEKGSLKDHKVDTDIENDNKSVKEPLEESVKTGGEEQVEEKSEEHPGKTEKEEIQEKKEEAKIKEKDNVEDIKTEDKSEDQNKSTSRERKKIDIANPDIIESFFKANND
jgi:cell division initiation protein